MLLDLAFLADGNTAILTAKERRMMGTRVQMAICKDCQKEKYDNEFWIVLEWMDKEELIRHIQGTVCPNCGGSNWSLTDYSMI